MEDRLRVQNGNYDQFLSDYDDAVDRDVPSRENSPANLTISSTSDSSSPSRRGYIEHRVSKFDTLAGVAIKYGVEVADIRKMNALVTDHHMFALDYLQIPLPGRHPPSHCITNGSNASKPGSSDNNSTGYLHHELFDSFQSSRTKPSQRKVSMAMSSLQGYYGLNLADGMSEGSEMPLHGKGDFHSSENGSPSMNSLMSDRHLGCHRKSKSLVNGILDEILGQSEIEPVPEAIEADSDRLNYKLCRRRQKSEADFTCTRGLLMKEENGSTGGFSAKTGKGLAQRPKAASRTTLTSDLDASGMNPVPIGFGDLFLTDGASGVRKSSSTSCLQEQDNSRSSSHRPTSIWSLKPDLQAFSTTVFDGLPKPLTSRKSKAALD